MTLRDELQALLGSTYHLDRELAGGGMSRVFVATEVAFGRTVVVKVLHPELAAEVTAERFAREIQLAARLQQANIVPLLTAGHTGTLPFYTMPFVDGLSLRQRITEHGPLPVAEAVGILRDVARALSYAHDAGVVHRDIKPENILLSHGAAVVTDFGIAKALSAARTSTTLQPTLTQAGSGVGTPAYMAPEQAAGDPSVDHRADIYAFGCVAYELLSGLQPFRGASPAELMAAQLTATAEPLRSLRPETPPALAALVERCLEKKPEHRPQKARELLDALESVTTPSGVRAPIIVPSWRTLAAAGLALAAVAVIVSLYAWRGRGNSASVTTEPTVAVIPFVNVGGDSTQDYLADGVSDELATAIGRIPSVHMAARSAAYRFRGRRDVDVRELGRALQVNFVVQGTLRRLGDQLRISAQVSEASSGRELWSDSFDRTTKDVFRTQDEMSRAIANALAGRVRSTVPLADVGVTKHQGTTDAEAYDLYLRGEFFLRRRQVKDASAMFEQAIAQDARFARAYAGLSHTLALAPYYAAMPAPDVHARILRAAQQALSLDSTLAEAHTSIALAHMNAWEWDAAREEFERAVAADPSDVEAHFQFGRLWFHTGEDGRAMAEWERALQIDPYYALAWSWRSPVLLARGDRREATLATERAIQYDSTAAVIKKWAVYTAMAVGDKERVRTLSDRLPDVLPWLGDRAVARAAIGDSAPARQTIQKLRSARPMPWFGYTVLAMAYLAVGENAQALDALKHATDAHELWSTFLRVQDPIFDPVRHTPQWAALTRTVGLSNAPGALK
jgi:eukaryotic-like serine/threonine-protein kinase